MNAVFAAFFFANSAGAFVVSTRKRGGSTPKVVE